VIPKNFAPLGDYRNFLLEQKPTIYNDGTGESGDDDVAGNIIFFRLLTKNINTHMCMCVTIITYIQIIWLF